MRVSDLHQACIRDANRWSHAVGATPGTVSAHPRVLSSFQGHRWYQTCRIGEFKGAFGARRVESSASWPVWPARRAFPAMAPTTKPRRDQTPSSLHCPFFLLCSLARLVRDLTRCCVDPLSRPGKRTESARAMNWLRAGGDWFCCDYATCPRKEIQPMACGGEHSVGFAADPKPLVADGPVKGPERHCR